MKSSLIYNGLFRKFLNKGNRFDNVYYHGPFESDFIYVSKSGYVTEIEVKVSRSDYLADFNKSHIETEFNERTLKIENELEVNKHDQIKSGEYGLKHFYFCTPKGLLDISEVPEYCGLMECHDDGCVVTAKKAPQLPKARKIDNDRHMIMIRNMYFRYIELKRDKLKKDYSNGNQ